MRSYTPKKVTSDSDEFKECHSLLLRYYRDVNPVKKRLTYHNNFDDLANIINNFLKHSYKKRSVKGDYISSWLLCQIYNNPDTQKDRQLAKLESIKFALEHIIENAVKTIITVKDWKGSKNKSNPQWADYLVLNLNNRSLRKFSCIINTTSPYYRFGIKLLHKEGKLFGDGVIQSQYRPEVLLHIGKNFEKTTPFVTTYINGIRLDRNRYATFQIEEPSFKFEVNIDSNYVFHVLLHDREIYNCFLSSDNYEILKRAVIYVWGDGHDPDPELNFKNIEIETFLS